MSSGRTPGYAGVVGIVAGVLAVSWVITFVTGSYTHWPFVLLGLVVGAVAVQAIHRK